MSKARDVKALLIEMSMLPIHAPSMRTCATRLPPPSTTAMFMGWPISAALRSAAAITLLASSKVTMRASPLLLLQRVKVTYDVPRVRVCNAEHGHGCAGVHRAGIADPGFH